MTGPDSHDIYMKREVRISNLSKNAASVTSSVKYPSDGWGK